MKKRFSLGLLIAMIQLIFESLSFASGPVSLFSRSTVAANPTSIHGPTETGHRAEITRFIGLGPTQTDARDRFGYTPLHEAASTGNRIEVLRLIAENPANINTGNRLGYRPLHYAAWNGQTATAQALLDHGADVDAVTQSYFTPLHLAAWKGHTAIVRALIAAGANIYAAIQNGKTPLQLAQEEDHPGIVAELQPAAMAQTHTHEALRQAEFENHELAARSHTWAAENHTVAGNLDAAIASYTAARISSAEIHTSIANRLSKIPHGFTIEEAGDRHLKSMVLHFYAAKIHTEQARTSAGVGGDEATIDEIGEAKLASLAAAETAYAHATAAFEQALVEADTMLQYTNAQENTVSSVLEQSQRAKVMSIAAKLESLNAAHASGLDGLGSR